RSGHPHPDQQVAVTHRSRTRRAARPAETLRSFRVTLAKRFARPRFAAFRVRFRVVLQPQRDRIDAEPNRELVDRGFETERAGRFAGAAVEGWSAEIELDEPLARLDVRHVIE